MDPETRACVPNWFPRTRVFRFQEPIIGPQNINKFKTARERSAPNKDKETTMKY